MEIDKIRYGPHEKAVQGIADGSAQQQAHTGADKPVPGQAPAKKDIQSDQRNGDNQKEPPLIFQYAKGSSLIQDICKIHDTRNDRNRFMQYHQIPDGKLAELIQDDNQKCYKKNWHRNLLVTLYYVITIIL